MNEMDLLERLGDDIEADPVALLRARRRLLRQALATTPRRRMRPRRLLLGAAAAVVTAAAFVLATVVVPGPGGGADVAAAQVLSRAALAADVVAGPAPGQWLHVRTETVRWSGAEPERTVQESWIPGDSDRRRRFRDFEGLVYVTPLDLPEIATRPDVSADEVHTWLMRDSGDLRGADAAFERAGETLADHEIPMRFKARLLEAVKQIDGTRVVDEDVAFGDRRAIVVGRADDGYETQLAFDLATGEFVGYRGVRDHGRQPDYQTLLQVRVVDVLPARARTCIAIGDEDRGFRAPPGCDLG